MNLIERAREASGQRPWAENKALLHELAGEVERCWAEINSNEHEALDLKAQINLRDQALAERDAALECLRGLKDEKALAAASASGFQHGFRLAVSTLWPVVGTLLKDPHHGEEA